MRISEGRMSTYSCPACGSRKTAIVMTNTLAEHISRRVNCRSCGYVFTELESTLSVEDLVDKLDVLDSQRDRLASQIEVARKKRDDRVWVAA